jgi:hypothetical protein
MAYRQKLVSHSVQQDIFYRRRIDVVPDQILSIQLTDFFINKYLVAHFVAVQDKSWTPVKNLLNN